MSGSTRTAPSGLRRTPLPRAVRGAPRAFFDAAISSPLTEACILWPYAKRNGYGVLAMDGGAVTYAHRAVCAKVHGAPPPRADAAHRCGVRACINPAHLRWASRTQNKADELLHGTRPRGSRHGRARLTEEQVIEIFRNVDGLGSTEWGRRLRIEPSAISAIWAGRKWAHITREINNERA